MNRRRRGSDRMYSRAYYSYGSEAYKYYPETEYGRRRRRNMAVEKRVKKTPKPERVRKHRTHYEFVKARKGDFKVCFSIGTLFSFIIVFVCLFAINTQKESEINANISQLKKLEESNSVLQTEMTKNVNLEEIEKIARTKLNMQKPAPHQIVYIQIPKQSYTVSYDDSTAKKEEDFSLKNIWNNLVGD